MRKILLLLLALSMTLMAPAQKSKTQQGKRKQPAATAQKKTAVQEKSASQSAKQSSAKKPTKAELQARQKKLKAEQEAARKRQKELVRQVGQRLQEAQALASEIEDKQMVIDSIRHEVAVLDSGIAVLDQELKALQKELDERREHYKQSVRYMYRNRKSQNQMMFLLSAKNFNQMYRRLRFSDDYATYQKAQSKAVRLKQEQVDQKQQELQGVKSEKTRLLTRSEKEQQVLEDKRAAEQKMVASLRKEQKTVQNLMAQQKKEENELNNSIQKIIEEERERARLAAEAEARRKAEAEARRQAEMAKAAQAKAAQANSKGKNSKNAKGSKNDKKSSTKSNQATAQNSSANSVKVEKFTEPAADRKLSGSFTSNKGRLPYPITGRYKVIRGIGNYVIDKVTLPSKSLYIKGEAGAKARCVFDGVVTGIVERTTDYVVLVRHGRYISVYSNVAKPAVKTGDQVKTNQTLGSLCSDNMLVFQLRNWTEPLNPKQWLRK